MFGKNDKTKIDHFVEVADLILKAAPNGLTATQIKALHAISEKLATAETTSFAAMIGALTKKKAVARRKPVAKKPAMSAATLEAIVSELENMVSNRSEFEAKIDQLNKAHSAPELKKITSVFVAGAKPKTKPEAVRILKAERNDRQRADAKANEAGKSRPW